MEDQTFDLISTGILDGGSVKDLRVNTDGECNGHFMLISMASVLHGHYVEGEKDEDAMEFKALHLGKLISQYIMDIDKTVVAKNGINVAGVKDVA